MLSDNCVRELTRCAVVRKRFDELPRGPPGRRVCESGIDLYDLAPDVGEYANV